MEEAADVSAKPHSTTEIDVVPSDVAGCGDAVQAVEDVSPGLSAPPTPLSNLPDSVYTRVFSCLIDWRSRLSAALVCRRWNNLLHSTPLDCIGVLNVFEHDVWHVSMATSDLRERFTTIQFTDEHQAVEFISHVRACNELKIWYSSPGFVARVLSLCHQSSVCGLALYPYAVTDFQADLQAIVAHLPRVDVVTMRPHGRQLFNCGITLPAHELALPSLNAINLENVALSSPLILPLSITELDWSAVRDRPMDVEPLFQAVKRLPQLKYLSLGQFEFGPRQDEDSSDNNASVDHQIATLLQLLQRLPDFAVLSFKFCKFHIPLDTSDVRPRTGGAFELSGLRVLRFELCYGEVGSVARTVIHLAPGLRLLAVESMLSGTDLHAHVYDQMGLLAKRAIGLKMSALHRFSPSVVTSESLEKLRPPPDISSAFSERLTRLDISFIEDTRVVNALFNPEERQYPLLCELRAIRCKGLSNASVSALASACPRLCKLYLNGSGEHLDANCLLPLVLKWKDRSAPYLRVVVCGTGIKVLEYCDLVRRECLVHDDSFRAKIYSKSLPSRNFKRPNDEESDKANFRLQVWTVNPTLSARHLVVCDYPPNHTHAVLGFVMPQAKEELQAAPALEPEE